MTSDLHEVLRQARAIWGDRVTTPEEVVPILATVVGDVARAVRDGALVESTMARELGNLIVTSVRLLDDHSIDPAGAVERALSAQRGFVSYGRIVRQQKSR